MRRFVIFVVFILCSFAIRGQAEVNLANTKWFSPSTDSSFYKSDTVTLINYSSYHSGKSQILENASEYTQGGHYLELTFKTGGVLELSNVSVPNWTVSKKTGNYNWKYDKSTKLLSLYFNKTKFLCLHVLTEKFVEVKNTYIDPAKVRTREILFTRINCG